VTTEDLAQNVDPESGINRITSVAIVIGGLAAIVAGAGRVVCGDTGVSHLATAFGTPSVVLFGPTSPKHWGPPPDRREHRALWAGTQGDPHASVIHPGLLRIEVADVLNELAQLDRLPRAA
jgi:ADP-heptose:LPS heptosyltransferase